MKNVMYWLAMGLLLGGCGSFQTVATVPLHEVLENLEEELSRIALGSSADLLSKNPARKANSIKFIRSRQCAYGSANPLLLSPEPELALALKGTYSRNGAFKVTGIPVAPSGEISASVAAGSENTLNLKLRMVTLSGIPRDYLRVAGNFLSTPNIPKKLSEDFHASMPKTYAALAKEITDLMESFDPATCPPPTKAGK